MNAVLSFLVNTFDVNVMILFIISGLFLIFLDSKEYKKDGFKKEYKFARFFGIFYIVAGIILYTATRFIRS
jgi:hypothetical protein